MVGLVHVGLLGHTGLLGVGLHFVIHLFVPQQGAASQLLSRIRIIGAVAPGTPSGDDGVALLSLDGKPARAVKIGQTIDGDMVLLALNQRQAEIGPMGGPTLARIDLPRLSPAATSTLPPPSGATLTPPPSAVPPPPAMPPAATPPDNPEPPPGPDGES